MFGRSNEKANGAIAGGELKALAGKRGRRFSADVRLDGGENGGDGVGEAEKEYLSWPGPRLTGRGDGGVGGEDEGEGYPFLSISSNEIVISLSTISESLFPFLGKKKKALLGEVLPREGDSFLNFRFHLTVTNQPFNCSLCVQINNPLFF